MTHHHDLIHRMADELDHYRQLETDDRREVHPLAVEARAALAQPEPEVVGPTDEDAIEAAAELIYAEAMEWAARQPIPHGSINIPAWQQGGNSDAQAVARRTARTVLSRRGRPAPAPAGEEVAWLVDALRNEASAAEQGHLWMTPGELRRAANLLERQAVPVPVAVSDRLPQPEDCDAEGQCWAWDYLAERWGLWPLKSIADGFYHWLPAHALPIPKQGDH